MKYQLSFLLILSTFLALKAQAPLQTILQRGHEKPVSCVIYSPDGKYLASGSFDNTIKLWELQSGFEIRSFHSHTAKVHDVVFSPDGKLIASVAADHQICVHDIVTGELKHQFEYLKNDLWSVRFSSDARFLITLDNRDDCNIWDLKTNTHAGSVKKDYSGRFNTHSIPNGNLILPHVKDYNTLTLIDVMKKDTLFALDLKDFYAHAFSKDGQYMVIGSSKLETHVIDLKQKKLLHTLVSDSTNQCHGCKTKIAYANLSNLVLSGDDKNGLSLWEVPTGKKRYTLPLTIDFDYIEFSSNDEYFLVNSSDEMAVYDAKTGKELYKLENDYLDYFTPHFAPKGNQIVVPSAYNTFSIVDFVANKTIRNYKGYLNQERNDGLNMSYSNWIDTKILQYVSMKAQVAISPDAKTIVKGNVDSSVFVIDVESGRLIKKLKGHKKLVYRFEFSHDGKILATAGGDRYIILWNTSTWEEIGRLKGHVELIFDVKFSSDDKQITSSAWDGYVMQWDVKSLTRTNIIDTDNSSVYSLAYSPDDLYVLQNDLGKKNQLMEQDSRQVFGTLVGHTNVVSQSLFTSNNQIVTSSWDGTVKFWDDGTNRLLAKHKEHKGAVLSLALAKETNSVYSGGIDGEIVVWDYQTKQKTKQIKAHMGAITSLNIAGKYLVSGSSDGEIKVWELNTLTLLYTYMQINQNDWLVTNTSGFFDGTNNAQQYVNYVKGLEVVPISSMFNKYFTPNLSKRIMSGEKFSYNESEFNKKLQLIPSLELGFASKDNHLIYTDSVLISKSNFVYLDLKVNSSQSLLYTTHVYRNGKLVKNVLMQRGQVSNENHVGVHLNNGLNTLTIVVENELGYESKKQELKIFHDGKKFKTDLYVLAIGINEYQNPSYHLNYAAQDADAFLNKLNKGSDSLFSNTYFYHLSNTETSKATILSKWQEIEKEIGPEDVFVFYFAGHGVMSIDEINKQFFLIPFDQKQMYGTALELAPKSISGEELTQLSTKLSAEKQLYIIDACQSGGAIQTFASRGFEREKALAQLARSTGTYFLTASQDYQFANESTELKHGIFTYSILEALSGNDATSALDKKITVGELKNYVEERVPELSKQYHTKIQYPQSYGFGQDFPLVLIR